MVVKQILELPQKQAFDLQETNKICFQLHILQENHENNQN